MQVSSLKRLALAVGLSFGISLVPVIFPLFSILWFAGDMVVLHLYPDRFQVTLTFKVLIVVVNVIFWSVGLYFGSVLWEWQQTLPAKPEPPAAKAVLIFWLVLLVPWLILAPLSGMAFDAGDRPEAYAVVWSVWTYPVTLIIVMVLRRSVPWIFLLPIVNFAGCLAGGLFPKGA
jgi:hypothetical protein